jgi:diguanylate cyclase (GGDEF)-like protein
LKVYYRLFASLLLFLLLSVGASLLASQRLAQASIGEFARLHALDLAADLAALLLSAALFLLGFRILLMSKHNAERREEMEREMRHQQSLLEKRIEERTRELSQEVEERRRAEEFNRGQKQVLEILTAPRPPAIEEILHRLTLTVATLRRSWDCSLHRVDGSGALLQLSACSDVDKKLRRYLASIGAGFPDAPEAQACASGLRCVVEDMTSIRRPWSELLVANGVYSAWSVPFRLNAAEKVAGALTVYGRLRRGPTEGDLELTEAAARLAALVIEHRRLYDELVRNAYQDSLTDIPNRRSGESALNAAIASSDRRQEPLTVFWIDLDRFKRINDQLSHGTGDEVLRAVASRLRYHPQVNGNLARMGGDEFLVLAPGQEAADNALEIGRQLVEAIAAPIATCAGPVAMGSSIGVCTYPEDGDSAAELERNADLAMYHAKALGGGCLRYTPALTQEEAAQASAKRESTEPAA